MEYSSLLKWNHIGSPLESQTITATSLADLQVKHNQVRDETGLGASNFYSGFILFGPHHFGRFSYNGRIWGGNSYSAGDVPVFDYPGCPTNQEGLS